MIYFADFHWWEWHRKREDFRALAGQKCSIQCTGSMVDDPDVHMLRNGGVEGLSSRADTVNTGQNGGFQALNIAALAGAARIVLLGYDMKYTGGKSHWHGDHPVQVPEIWYTHFTRHFNAVAKMGLDIINATADTALTCFPRKSIEEALA